MDIICNSNNVTVGIFDSSNIGINGFGDRDSSRCKTNNAGTTAEACTITLQMTLDGWMNRATESSIQ